MSACFAAYCRGFGPVKIQSPQPFGSQFLHVDLWRSRLQQRELGILARARGNCPLGFTSIISQLSTVKDDRRKRVREKK
jgi:hypothetical protein